MVLSYIIGLFAPKVKEVYGIDERKPGAKKRAPMTPSMQYQSRRKRKILTGDGVKYDTGLLKKRTVDDDQMITRPPVKIPAGEWLELNESTPGEFDRVSGKGWASFIWFRCTSPEQVDPNVDATIMSFGVGQMGARKILLSYNPGRMALKLKMWDLPDGARSMPTMDGDRSVCLEMHANIPVKIMDGNFHMIGVEICAFDSGRKTIESVGHGGAAATLSVDGIVVGESAPLNGSERTGKAPIDLPDSMGNKARLMASVSGQDDRGKRGDASVASLMIFRYVFSPIRRKQLYRVSNPENYVGQRVKDLKAKFIPSGAELVGLWFPELNDNVHLNYAGATPLRMNRPRLFKLETVDD
nr:hypothetical protein [Sicyoidochytrium minutum DNA virus]